MPADQMIRMVRNTSKNPILERREREARYNIPKPANLRQGVSPAERAETNKHAAIRKAQQRAGNTSDKPEPTTKPGPAFRSTTDDFEDEFLETVAPIPTRKSRAVSSQIEQPQRSMPRYRRPVEGQAQPQQQEQVSWFPVVKWTFLILGALVVIYTALYLIIAAWIAVNNNWVYGSQNHTSYTQVAIKASPKAATSGTIMLATSNVNGTIYVTVIRNGNVTTYAGPTLKADAWNGDLNGVVATAKMNNGGSITVDLMGTMNYFHPLFVRPTMQFTLVPDQKSGYKVVMP